MASRLGKVESAEFYVRIGGAVGDVGEIKYGFVAPKDAYENIADELGVITIDGDDSARGVVFGANRPKPPQVSISYKSGTKRGSTKRFCDVDKLGRVLNGSLRDAKIKVAGSEFDITGVTMA